MRELASVARDAHVLPEAFNERHEIARRARGEEIPAKSIALVDRAAAGVLLHHLRRVARRVEGQRDEAYLAVQLRPRADRLLQRVEHAIGERTAVGIAARGIDEAEQRNASVRIARERRGAAIDAEHR